MGELTMPRGILFDFDGTLFDSMWVWRQLDEQFLRSHGIEPPPGIEEDLHSLTLLECCEYFRKRFDLATAAPVLAAQMLGMVAQDYAQAVEPKPGARELVAAFAALGTPMAVVTAADEGHVGAALTRCGLATALPHIFTTANTGLPKTGPAIFVKAAAALGLAPEDCLVVDDSFYATQAAHKAGCQVAGVYEPYSQAQWLAMQAQFPCFANLHELLQALLPQ